MIIISFSRKTSKILPRILCRNFRHCAAIVPAAAPDAQMIMYQFVRRGNIAKIPLRARDLKILGLHGWKFIYIPGDARFENHYLHANTCVDLTKRIAGLRNTLIQTPDALYKYIRALGYSEY